jgi:tetratricopeptide (TPR) repeat protein
MLAEGATMAADLEGLCKEGRLLFRQGKHSEAIQAFDEALRVDPDQADVHDAIATAHFVLKQYDKAIEHFTRVTQLRPMDCKAYINLGAVFNRKEEFQKAADILKRAISRNGKAVEAYYNLGIAYRGVKQPAMAINSYKEALKIDPRMLDAMQNLGNTYLEMNNPKAAIEQYKKALEINPDFERAKRGLARAEELENQTKASFNPFGRLVDQNAVKQAKVDVRPKKLTPEERVSDRQAVRRMIIETQGIAQQLHEHLCDQMLDDVTQLNRGVQMSQQEAHKSLFGSNERFQAAFQKFQNLRIQLQRLANDLHSHEATMKEKN